MKKWIVSLLVLAMLSVTVIPALAAPETIAKTPKGVFALVGRITAIGTDTVTIKVITGNILVKPYIGKELTVTVTAATRYLFKTGTTITPITFADLKVGQPVSANGKTANNIWTATRITVGAALKYLP
jgi:hypothetical protein